MDKYTAIRDGFYGTVTVNKDGEEKFSKLGKLIKLVLVLINIENHNITWLLSFDYKGKNVSVEYDRCDIINKKFDVIVGKGADIKPKTIDCAIQSITMQENSAKSLNIYTNVGWICLNNNGQLNYAYRSQYLVGSKGKYNGKYKLDSMGSFKAWREMVITDIIGRPALEAVLLASMSSIVNGLIGPSTTGENPIFHLCAASGTGKSTLGYVACSVFGEPYEGAKPVTDSNGIIKSKKSVFGSWSSTENALISDACGNQGMCIILNELGKYQGKDLTSIVYGFSDGVDKNRLNAKYDGSIKDNFCTSIISIGESSLIEKCKTKEIGIKTRVFEIDSQLTDDAAHSSRLKSASRENNGWAASKLAEHIINNGGLNYAKAIYDDIKAKLIKGIDDGQYVRFVEKFTALLVTTAIIANDSMNLGFDEQGIVNFCDDYWLKKDEENGAVDMSYNDTVEVLKVNEANFVTDKSATLPQECWGKINHVNKVVENRLLILEYFIRPGILKKILNDKGYNNADTYLKKWRDKGVLI